MRPDQVAKLRDLSEKLADVFIVEADPENWTAGGKLPCDLTREERGDRTWDRKGAMGTGGVLKTALDLLARHSVAGEPPEDQVDDELERMIREAEKSSAAALARVMSRAESKR